MPTELMPVPINHESLVWSSVRGTFLHYGGKTIFGNTANPYLNEYSATNGWSRVTTSGPSPGDLSGHCMVPGKCGIPIAPYGGTKMVLFGGTDLTENSSSAIYILDILTNQWTAGKSANVNQARCNMACAVAGDSFIAWGGDNKRVNMDVTPIVYDLVSQEWTTQFNLVSPSGRSPPPPSTGPNYAAIGGGVAGALVLLGLVAFLLFKRRKRNNKKREKRTGHGYQETAKSSEDSVAPFAGAPTPPKSESVSQAQSLSQQQQQQQQQHYHRQQEYDNQQYQYTPELEPRPMSGYESRPVSGYHSQHQSYYSSHAPAFAPYTPTPRPPPLQPRPIQQQDYVPMSPIESIATTANVTPEDSMSVYSPTSTLASAGYTRDVKMFSPTASTFAQSGSYSHDVKPISPTSEYAPASSAHFRTSRDRQIYIPNMAYTPIPGNPQLIPVKPPPESTTAVGTPRQNPQLYPEPGPSDESQCLLIQSQSHPSQQSHYAGTWVTPVTGSAASAAAATATATAERSYQDLEKEIERVRIEHENYERLRLERQSTLEQLQQQLRPS
ncbi:hypothetical protein BGZ96_003216 [Linnemannia gamsii]|uniref:Gram-positive cocci surface proteins LPxTG domain-containing protein n=1 Tax=Linnemannia gamsii TaxID=64522 RepID=A0ABQ7K8I9_9FUNG|nr:hypothetical protein BGZ96_003216 [Linnemannia gamsii]